MKEQEPSLTPPTEELPDWLQPLDRALLDDARLERAVALRPGASTTVTLQGYGFSTQTSVALTLPSGVRGTVSPTTLNPPWGVATIKLTADASLKPGSSTVVVRTGSTDLPITVLNLTDSLFVPFVRR